MRRIRYERIIQIMFEQNVGYQTAAYVAEATERIERRLAARKAQA